jgi:hypothetical protein
MVALLPTFGPVSTIVRAGNWDLMLALLEDAGCEVFCGDEAGFEGDPRPRQKWVKRGSRLTQAYQGSHVRQNIIGAANPIERLWRHLKGHCLAGYFTKQSNELSDKLVDSIRDLMDRPQTIRSVRRTHSE